LSSMGIGTGCEEAIKLKEFGVFDGPRLLEIGCGEGRITAQLAGKATCLVAVDPSAEDLLNAARRVDKALFSRASGVHLPFADRSFDTVLFTLSLHHQDSRLALKEAGRVVAPDGRILVMEPAVDGEAQQLFHFFEDETAALESAMAAIVDSHFRVMQATQFEADWQFNSKHEFSRYMFAYHTLDWNAQTEAGLFRQLGPKAEDEPLVLKDKLKLLCLAA
jgi:ubiquinone/menaquinone biosynthesis C-methylase UbiE